LNQSEEQPIFHPRSETMNTAQAWRRWFGLAFLALAFGMLVWGQTVLKPKLDGAGYIVYWTGCFFFTFLALITALIDIWCVRRRQRNERRNLLKKTFTELNSVDDDPDRNGTRSPGND
jgi:hypothetical protein